MKKTILIIAVFLAVKSYSQVWSGSTNTSGNTFRNGNVGIGTSNPLGLLDLGLGGSNRKIILWQDPSYNNDHDFYGFGINPSVLRYQVGGVTASHVFYSSINATSSKELIRFTGDGKVGIGTSKPSAILHVNNGNNSYGTILANATETPFSLYAKTLTTGPIYCESFRLGLKHNNDENNGFISFYRGDNTYGGFLGFSTSGQERMKISTDGKVSIGGVSSTPGTYKLYVKDGILTEKVKVALSGTANWADYVFSNGYKLKSLSEVESYIKENKHLPNIPSSEEIKADGGLDVAEMMAKQMEKIEELTLYTIQQQKEIEELKNLVKSVVKK